MNWAVATYDSAFGYVSAHGAPLVDLLDPQPDERIIDLGCGTGLFAATIAERGAEVLGIDGSPEMIAQAAAAYPQLSFAVGDAHDFTTSEPYDAVASNAALHWMTRDPDAVIGAVHAALRPGGRFVAEMGGAGNCAELIAAMQTAWRIFGLAEPELPWYFPTPAEYTSKLEAAGFTVRLLEYFDRPTRMTEGPGGAADWVRVFAASALKEVPPEIVEPLLARINELAAPALRRESGWVADYVRLRFAAVRKPDGSAPMPEGPAGPAAAAGPPPTVVTPPPMGPSAPPPSGAPGEPPLQGAPGAPGMPGASSPGVPGAQAQQGPPPPSPGVPGTQPQQGAPGMPAPSPGVPSAQPQQGAPPPMHTVPMAPGAGPANVHATAPPPSPGGEPPFEVPAVHRH